MSSNQEKETGDTERMNATLKRMLNTPPKQHKHKPEEDTQPSDRPKKTPPVKAGPK